MVDGDGTLCCKKFMITRDQSENFGSKRLRPSPKVRVASYRTRVDNVFPCKKGVYMWQLGSKSH
jgi:hypothetical protein